MKGHLVGYVDGLTYRIWIPTLNTIIRFGLVKFGDELLRGDVIGDMPFTTIEEPFHVLDEITLSLLLCDMVIPRNIVQGFRLRNQLLTLVLHLTRYHHLHLHHPLHNHLLASETRILKYF